MPEVQSSVEYRDVPGFPGYRVGDDGSVLSAWARRGRVGFGNGVESYIGETWRPLKPRPNIDGYHTVMLCRRGTRKTRRVHHLVLEAFVGPRPKGMEACHDPDRTRTNNRLSNLRWDTRKSNALDAVKHGTTRIGSANNKTKLTPALVAEIRRLYAAGEFQYVLAVKYGMHQSTISDIVRRQTWKHVAGDK